MIHRFVLCAVFLITAAVSAAHPSKSSVVGRWQMVSRVDHDLSGKSLPEPTLGPEPIGYLIYDFSGHAFAQLMARHRPANLLQITARPDSNNSGDIGGYTAYFGRYEIHPGGRDVEFL